MTENHPSRDITRTTLAVLFIVILAGASGWILYPFLQALLWATMIVVSTWNFMLSLQGRLWGKRSLAVMAMTLVLLLVFIIPSTLAVISVVERVDDIVAWVRSLSAFTLPPPPAWIENLPLAGPKAAERWRQLAAAAPEELSARLTLHARDIARAVVAQAGNLGLLIVQILLTVIISAVLYAKGETAGRGVCRFARRLAGKHGEDAAILAAKAVRGVAYGVILTALIQAFLAWIGLVFARIPAATVLAAFIFVLCVAQLGPHLVMLPVAAWLFWTGESLWGTVLLVWGIFVGLLDNVIRPVLIRRGADLPLILIFAGVIGGLIALGVIGLFIGPVMLAVTYTLLKEWVVVGENRGKESSADAASGTGGGMTDSV